MAREAPHHRRASSNKTAKHSKPRKHSASDKRRGSARERGYSTEWDKFSKAFRRMNPLCEYCLADGRTEPATVVDHDVPHMGDPDLFWNNTFSGLCKRCHDVTKQRIETRYSGDDLLREIAKLKKLR